MYRISYEGKQIELPNYSIKIAKKIDNLESVEGDIEFRLKSMYSFIEEMIGREAVEENLGKFQDADPNCINILCAMIVAEFNRPFLEHRRDTAMEALDPRLLKAVEQLDKLGAKK